MQRALEELKQGRTPKERVDFETLQGIVGFPEYDELLNGYDNRFQTNENPDR